MIKGTIESIAFGGEGILRHDGLVVFVPFTAPGDEVEVEIISRKKKFSHGKLLHLQKPSLQRANPRCHYFGTCGGCQLQHMNYPAQVEAKRTFVIDALKRIGKIDVDHLPITPADKQWDYRRHIRLTLKKEKSGFKAGYIGVDPSQVIPIAKCPLFLPSQNTLFGSLETFLGSLSNQGTEKGTLRIIKAFSTEESSEESGKFILAFNFSPHLPQNAKRAMEVLQRDSQVQGIVIQSLSEQISFGDVRCEAEFLNLKVRFSPYGFLQNHPGQSELLYRAILKALPPSPKNILDLYCGIGVTSLLFAMQQKQVIGIESHAETIALAKENALLNKISTVAFYQGKAESLGVEFLNSQNVDAVLCNPPRTGIDPILLQALAAKAPPCILYVSCMPSTLARDLHKLILAGYRITSLESFDMFPQTTHVETLVVLEKADAIPKI